MGSLWHLWGADAVGSLGLVPRGLPGPDCHRVPFQMGFFKRTRPPTEGDTQEPGQAQEPGNAQEPGDAQG